MVITKYCFKNNTFGSFRHAFHFCISLVFKYNGGHVAATFVPDDMEFIYMVLRVARPDGKPLVPIWVITEENAVCFDIKPKLLRT